MAALAFRPADLDRATMVVVSPPHRWTSAIVAALVPPELQRDGFQFFPIITRQLFEDSGSEAAFSGICLEAHQLFAFDVEELQNDVDQLVNSDVVEVLTRGSKRYHSLIAWRYDGHGVRTRFSQVDPGDTGRVA